jgi:hypothetical protein
VSSTGQRNTRLMGEASLSSIGRCCGGPLLGEDKGTIWEMREAGVPVKRIAKHLGRQNSSPEVHH